MPDRSGARPRVLVVGTGIAGLTAALHASAFAEVTVLTKSTLEESNTRYAQGGIAAAVFDDDSSGLHAVDTLRAGAGLCEEDVVGILCSEGPALVRELQRVGVPFDRDAGDLARGLEAAHSRARILHAGGDATGLAIETTLARRARARDIRIVEHTMLTDLVVDDGRAVGVRALDATGRVLTYAAEAVVLATGGAGRLFSHTTNPAVATGDGVAAAWRAGAQLADLEFYQFHPTALAVPGGCLVSEAVRGEGAVLLDADGTRFMRSVHPDAELAPRDVVARGIARQMAETGGMPVLLDATGLGRDLLGRRFPTIQAACLAAGLDWAADPIPVTPAAHYWMGGVLTDSWARTTLPGLFAVGEVACTGAQGANRLASNSLLEGLVFAARASRAIAGAELRRSPLQETATAGAPPGRAGATGAVRELMWRLAGVERDGDGLRDARDILARLTRSAGVSDRGGDAGTTDDVTRSPFTVHEHRNLLTLATLLVRSALAREESRGAHHRRDFPLTNAVAAHSVVDSAGDVSTRLAGALAVPPSADVMDAASAREGAIGEAVATC